MPRAATQHQILVDAISGENFMASVHDDADLLGRRRLWHL